MTILKTSSINPSPARNSAVFALGFRPFFLLSGISAIVLVLLWLYSYLQTPLTSGYYTALHWHSHEMIFAYSVAVIAGFLLTAARNWTGVQTTHGKALAALALLWLSARVMPFFAAFLPHSLIAVVDLAFLPTLGVMLAVPILRKRQKQHLVFLFVLAALTVANLMIHSELLGYTQNTARSGIYSAVYLIVFLIAIMGGRVIPFFTEAAIPGAATRKWATVEYCSLGGLLLLILLDLFTAPPLAIISVAVFTALAHGIRLFGWYHRAIWSQPLLWILHLAYAWLVAGLILKTLATAELVNPMLATHAFTSAGIGSMTLGMMARVTLGHTGRELRPGQATTLAFILISLAGVSRVLLPIISPATYPEFIALSGTLWCAAFAIFVFTYAGFLIRPRVDGKPG